MRIVFRWKSISTLSSRHVPILTLTGIYVWKKACSRSRTACSTSCEKTEPTPASRNNMDKYSFFMSDWLSTVQKIHKKRVRSSSLPTLLFLFSKHLQRNVFYECFHGFVGCQTQAVVQCGCTAVAVFASLPEQTFRRCPGTVRSPSGFGASG